MIFKKGNKIIEIEDFPDSTYIAWKYKEGDKLLNDGISLRNKKEMKKFVKEIKGRGFK